MKEKNTMFKFKLGEKIVDKITGFNGIIMSRTDYLFGHPKYGILSEELEKGKPQDWVYIDENSLTKNNTEKKTQIGIIPKNKKD